MIVERSSHASQSRTLPIFRITPSNRAELVLQLDEPVWFRTHWSGRQFLCSGDGCPGCSSIASKLRGFMPCGFEYKGATRPVLLEVTPTSWERALASGEMCGYPPKAGVKILATRRKTNSPLILDPIGEGFEISSTLNNRSTTVNAVAVIHGLSPMNSDESIDEWLQRTKVARELLLQNATK